MAATCIIQTNCKIFAEEPDPPAPLPFLEAANDLITQYSLQFPITIADAISLYAELVVLMEN